MELIINDRIRSRTIKFFNEINILLRYDAVASSFRFGYYFNADNPELKDMSCIGHYHIATIRHNNQTILTGNVLSEEFDDANTQSLNTMSGGSLPGVLEDCNLTTSIQFNTSSLLSITEQIVKPFGLKIKYDPSLQADLSSTYQQVQAKPTDNIKQYLSELAAQKNIILSHDEFGNIVFRKARPGRLPDMNFTKSPSMNMKLSFNGQGIHSDITVMEQADFDSEIQTTVNTVKNPYVIGTVYRPKTIVKTSGDTEVDLKETSKNAVAQELRNLQLMIKIEGWMTNMSKIVMPGMVLSVQNKNIYLYKKMNWFVETVELVKDSKMEECTINCVPTPVYDGSDPTYPFKGINLH